MFIQTEQTPNPQTLKFLPGKVVMEEGTAFFQNIDEASISPLATRLFSVEGVSGVFLGSDFITITKAETINWEIMKPLVLGSIMDHFNSGEETYLSKKTEDTKKSLKENSNDSEIVKQIKELLDTRVRPAVAMDGGDIIYDSFKDGIVYLHMQGACSGCPSSTATLKMGIENMLKHYIPEVQEVRPTDA
ncbi:MAG: Fe/S biogenesis protein NfuA [Alphaproteobacteria bacterium MarineAlpha5_Bin5]|nr:MAG: Fe/S biogenesis protein NfuA [Alphaproteobacteria bacterium MarineAlpha5_Bin5]PPR52433.1 MAG: Fe/S biogenesis protein NfuA [Alphaproteobacteria bacterium MarineAlpha5_Bin4]|tara:strand:- start:620 stop:1186 length:567 start_codon:yes stop_codon:yes gene_type:complete